MSKHTTRKRGERGKTETMRRREVRRVKYAGANL